ncbi:MAG: hypothetical protein WBW93_01875 [Steroidobacteraceae bacterium]
MSTTKGVATRSRPRWILDSRAPRSVAPFGPIGVRGLLEHVGLPFDPACLEFHLNPAPVITASSAQVRQPLYSSALEQWRHYEAWLAPARERFEAAGIPLD